MTRASGTGGSVSLELALTVPALALLVLVVLHAAVYARDALLVQAAAQRGARVAATTTDDATVAAAVRDALDGRDAAVTVTARGPVGQPVRVQVTMRSRAGQGRLHLTAVGVGAVEPGTVP